MKKELRHIKNKNTNPLRKIVRYEGKSDYYIEHLECGHKVISGMRDNSDKKIKRRRCLYCGWLK